MDSALAWIGQIAAWCGQFIPRREILDLTEGAIKYRHGDEAIECGPGIHWWWPYVSKWSAYPTARQTDRLETQTMETKDGQTFVVGAMITYGVTDLKALMTTTHSPSRTVIDIAMGAVHDVCCEYGWPELQEAQRRGTIKTQLRNEAQKQLKDYGVQVVKLQLNTLAKTRVIKLMQSIANEEN